MPHDARIKNLEVRHAQYSLPDGSETGQDQIL